MSLAAARMRDLLVYLLAPIRFDLGHDPPGGSASLSAISRIRRLLKPQRSPF
jgi:hypothetical protein